MWLYLAVGGWSLCSKDILKMSVCSNISWAAYHANQQPEQGYSPTITAMLPLFPDDSKHVALICHSMDMVKKAVHDLNPTQIPVIILHQPLYAIAKLIQWNWPDTYGEKHFVCPWRIAH